MIKNIILASTSAIRKTILEHAGLKVTCVAPNLDEDAAKSDLVGNTPQHIAVALAEQKALSLKNAQGLVIAADQTLSCGATLFNKPQSLHFARQQLSALRGKAHMLHSAVACAENGEITWSTCVDATLVMRNFSDDYLDRYISDCGDDILSSVGCYKLERIGVQLFEKIEGDYFVILGLPLLPLLAHLRQTGHITS